MRQQGETPAPADDWWHRLYQEPAPVPAPAPDPLRPQSPTGGASLDEHFASATAVAAPITAPAGPPIRPRAWWEPEEAPALTGSAAPDPTVPAPGSAPEPPPAAPGRSGRDRTATAEGRVRPPSGPEPTADDGPSEPVQAAEPVLPPPLPGTGPMVFGSPSAEPPPEEPGAGAERVPPSVPEPPTADAPESAAAEGEGEGEASGPVPGVPDPRVPRALEAVSAPDGGGHPGYIGDGPPTYDADPTALPMADPEALDGLVPDTVLDGARYGTWTLRAASVRGDSARYRGDPRKDALLTARFGTGDNALVLIAVATGSRAAPDAHRAAADACRLIGGAVGRSHFRLTEDIRAGRRDDLRAGLHRLTDRSVSRLRALAAERGRAPDDYTAGLRCLLLTADPDCRHRIFFGIGPGGLFRLRDGAWAELEPAAVPPEYEDPAPPPPEPFRFRVCTARPGDTLLLCAPGLADPLREAPGLGIELARRWHSTDPPPPAAFLADVQLRVKGYADDRTAVAVYDTLG
ncbi:protein phosphatase 2C domain-containing protein [Streptomyces sp. NPDC006798]|uniref:protein phosphatase 2C domain-containing protein n=1 Tax=Streptomyces sp. NPDC006798 TaxID=3155462 RepID=UPI0033F81D8A